MDSNVQDNYIKTRIGAFLLALLISFSSLYTGAAYAEGTDTAEQTGNTETVEETEETREDGNTQTSEETGSEETGEQEEEPEEEPAPVKSGLIEENGKLYYYLEDGSLFKDGIKKITVDGKAQYYYFTEDGSAFTGGYKKVTIDGKKVYYYFQKDGTAYTDGYKKVTIDGKKYYYYFKSNGQAFNTGYKTVTIDGVKRYFYFKSNGQAYTDGYKSITNSEGKKYYYYFKSNGQAYTEGYKSVKIDGKTYYFFFGENGKAFTGGLKKVKNSSGSHKYFFKSNGRAYTSGWKTVDGKRCYFQKNGIMATGWTKIDGAMRYMKSDGTMAKNAVVGGGYVDANGVKDPSYDSMLKKAKGYSSSTKYLILVNTKTCRVGVFVKDDGKWVGKYYWQCAPGKSSTPTIKGTFTVGVKGYYFDSGNCRCFYYTQISGNYLFHSVLYSQRSTNPAKAGVIDGTLGKPASHGCVRMKIDNAKWIYDNIPKGTKVVTY